MRLATGVFKGIETRYRLFLRESILGITYIMRSVPLKVSSSVPKPMYLAVNELARHGFQNFYFVQARPSQSHWQNINYFSPVLCCWKNRRAHCGAYRHTGMRHTGTVVNPQFTEQLQQAFHRQLMFAFWLPNVCHVLIWEQRISACFPKIQLKCLNIN